jgi:diadenosine tetraphosphate (Ap4A) HIT family hydrolase
VDANVLAWALRDAYPVSPGHTLIVPRRHVASFFELTPEEQSSMLDLARRQKAVLDAEFAPAGYNLGINDGAAAGQTVAHVHLHLIPRYAGDSPDPRGGVRWVLPAKAAYWSHSEP